jgi:hypothetical protein
MFLWYPVLDLARAPRRTARKKGFGYENVQGCTILANISLVQNPKGPFALAIFTVILGAILVFSWM